MINSYFISIIIPDKNTCDEVHQFLTKKYNTFIKKFYSIEEFRSNCLHSLNLIITNLDINQFSEFIGIKVIKLNEELNNKFINSIDLELKRINEIENILKRILKENTIKVELFSNKFNIDNLDNFIFYLLSKFLTNMSFEVKYSVAIILKESVSNAFYHGNFGIESRIKSEENGFEKFYNIIEEKQKDEFYNSKKVYIEMTLKVDKLTISVEDKGKGFNYKEIDSSEKESSYGRGLKLIKVNSDFVTWNNNGNKIIIEKNLNG